MNIIKGIPHLIATNDFKNSIIGLNKKGINSGREDNHILYKCSPPVIYEAQHLYITTDEHPKKDDYFIQEGVVHRTNFDLEWGRKIVATTNRDLKITKEYRPEAFQHVNFPLIPASFIDQYIKAYNDGNPIKKVLLEQIDNGYEVDMEGRGGMDAGDTCWMPKLELKLNIDGCVIIHPVEEKMYTKAEAKEIAVQASGKTRRMKYRGQIEEWFDKNYPQ